MKSLIQAEEVAFYYPQDRRGLNPISINIRPGEAHLINGLSGCGKSTLARCLSGLIPHLYRGNFQGTVLVDDQPSEEMEMWQLSEKIGLVFQNPAFQILAPTVQEEILFGLENLGISREQMRVQLEEILDRFQLQSFRFRSPQTLSGGEQQKLALAAIMARRPQALVLDEPLSMLDTTSAIEFVEYLEKSMNLGTSVVVCEHRENYLHHIPGLKTITLNGIAKPEPLQEVKDAYPCDCDQFSLKISDLTVELGGRIILDHLNLKLESGQVVAIVGRNGTGKTTLFRAITGLQRSSGYRSVTVGNFSETPQFSMIFQNPDTQLFNPTVREEILYHIKNPDPRLFEWLLAALDLKRYEHTPPLLLSEGEKRRVALATALMHQARHGVLLDEPSLGQDEEHKKILANLLKSLAKSGYLVIFSTHDLELAAQSDKMVLINRGGIVSSGNTKDVLAEESAWNEIGLVKPLWMRFSCFD
jgi:energy-coupling factor transport system ATP-binding protein